MYFEKTIIAVRLAGQQAFQLEFLGAQLQIAERARCFGKTVLVLFFLGKLRQGQRIFEFTLETAVSGNRLIKAGALLHQRLGGLLVIPKLGILGARVQLFQAFNRFVEVKDASSAEPWTA